jgi:hypothetical protein
MDPKIWKAAQRNHFPYNVSLELIVGVPLFFPIIYLVLNLALFEKNYEYLKTIL